MGKLSRTKVETVKRHFREWKQREQEADAIPIEMDKDLLINYMEFLGFKDTDFTGLPEKVYNIATYKGTKMIWDFLKKHLFRGEERAVAQQKPPSKKKQPA